MKYIGCLFAFLLVAQAHGAVPAKKSAPANKILSGEGISIGGLAGSGFTLMDVRKTLDAKKKVERIVVDVGDLQGFPMKGLPGYYHAQLQKNPHRLVIDFSQMPKSRISEILLSSRLKNSVAVRSSSLTFDPLENNMSMVLNLKPNTKARVYQVAGNKTTSKVVIDLLTE